MPDPSVQPPEGISEIDEVVGPITPRRLEVIQSVRLDPELAASLRDRANYRGEGVSDLLRVGAEMVLAASEAELDRAMQCPTCEGSGKRRWRLRGSKDSEEQVDG